MSTRVALVTGAARGIGAAVARTLAAGGAAIAALDTCEDGLASLVRELRERGCAARAFTADVRDPNEVEAVVGRIEHELGPIDTLVNVAGVLRQGAAVALSDEDWALTFDVNTHGVFHVSRAVARRMMPRRAGCIVTVSSNAASTPRMKMAAYAASKAAATMFTRCLGLELAPHNIRCNVVSPGSTDTDMLRGMWTDERSEQAVIAGTPETFRVGIPLGRIASPADVANAVAFLVSEQARHITLHDLRVDGGATLGV